MTTLYLIRHGATAANLAVPAKLQGRRSDPPLAPEGVAQAEAARDRLAATRLAAIYTSPLRRAAETAAIVAAPHGLTPTVVPALTECDVGEWDGASWDEVRARDPHAYAAYMADQATVPYMGGESFAAVLARAAPIIDALAERHAGGAIAVVSHHVVLRTYLAARFGRPLTEARQVALANGEVVELHGSP